MTNIIFRDDGARISVLIHGVDARMIASAEAHLMASAIEAGAKVTLGADPGLVGTVPKENYFSGFLADPDPDRSRCVLRAIKDEADVIPWATLTD